LSYSLDACFSLNHLKDGYVRVDTDSPSRGMQVTGYGGDILLGGNLIPVERATHKIDFPHLATTDGWDTLMGIINLGEQSETVELDSYDGSGTHMASETVTLVPGQKVEYDAFYMAGLPSGAVSLTASVLSGSDCLLGYAIYSNSSTQSRTFLPVPLDQQDEIVLPHTAFGPYWWTGVVLFNPGGTGSEVTITGYDQSGQAADTQHLALLPNQNWVKDLDSVYAASLHGTIASVKFTSSKPIEGFALYGNGGSRVAATPLGSAHPSPLYLPQVASDGYWWTGVGFVYSGVQAGDVSVSLFNQEGALLGSKLLVMNSNAHFVFSVKDLFGFTNATNGSYVSINSDAGSLSGMYLIGSNDGLVLMGDALSQ
jgi:hypothetical protein